MSSKKKDPVVRIPKKTFWHLYSLQNLEGDKLVKVVDKILRKEYVVVK